MSNNKRQAHLIFGFDYSPDRDIVMVVTAVLGKNGRVKIISCEEAPARPAVKFKGNKLTDMFEN